MKDYSICFYMFISKVLALLNSTMQWLMWWSKSPPPRQKIPFIGLLHGFFKQMLKLVSLILYNPCNILSINYVLVLIKKMCNSKKILWSSSLKFQFITFFGLPNYLQVVTSFNHFNTKFQGFILEKASGKA